MSKFFLKIALPMALIAGGMMVSTQFTFGKAEYTKKEKKGCTYCHVAAGKKDLNDMASVMPSTATRWKAVKNKRIRNCCE